MKTIKIEVTQEDIDNGLRRECGECPIALAATRAFGTPCRVGVATLSKRDPEHTLFTLPTLAELFVFDFDNGKPVSPFEFELHTP